MGTTAKRRAGGITPLKNEIGRCIGLFRARQIRSGRGSALEPGVGDALAASPPAVSSTVHDILLLGRIAYAWETIAGPDLRRFVYPMRLHRGRLWVCCADSQWMQNLTYLKPQILDNIRRRFPEARITTIQGRLGTIHPLVQETPARAWPDWRLQPEIDLPEVGSPELRQKIQTCRRKLRARLQGLAAEGYHLCRKCSSNLVPRALEICSICQQRARELDLAQTRHLLCDTPWLTFEETREQVPGLQKLEFDALRSELAGEARSRVRALGEALRQGFETSLWMTMRYEMIRAVIFETGLPPHLVDLDDPTGRFHLEPEWAGYLALGLQEAPEC
jgi:hypothetical protein